MGPGITLADGGACSYFLSSDGCRVFKGGSEWLLALGVGGRAADGCG